MGGPTVHTFLHTMQHTEPVGEHSHTRRQKTGTWFRWNS